MGSKGFCSAVGLLARRRAGRKVGFAIVGSDVRGKRTTVGVGTDGGCSTGIRGRHGLQFEYGTKGTITHEGQKLPEGEAVRGNEAILVVEEVRRHREEVVDRFLVVVWVIKLEVNPDPFVHDEDVVT